MSIHLYNLTLQNPGVVYHAVAGNFTTKGNDDELLVSHGSVLELMRINNYTLETIASTSVFGIVRSLATYRLHGTTKDYAIIGSDSGKITVVEFSTEKNTFVKVLEETFGRSGVRRIVPGQYMAVDPAGRACMIGAIEKQKFVYILNRDNAARLTISSPLEAHKSHTFTYDIVGIDVGFSNPLFAAIELDYSKVDLDSTGQAAADVDKVLTWYELDLGGNHVIRQHSDILDRSAHRLISVPGGNDGPGGVIICSKSCLTYRSYKGAKFSVNIPRRLKTVMTGETGPDEGVLIVSNTIYRNQSEFWYIVQTEHGDLFYVTLDVIGGKEPVVQGIAVQYMDTVPVSYSIVFLDHYLFCASETGAQPFYNVKGKPTPDDINLVPASEIPNGNSHQPNGDGEMDVTESNGLSTVQYFKPRPLKYLEILSEIPSLAPITDLKVQDFVDEPTRILALCGSGPRSSLRVMYQGVQMLDVGVSSVGHHITGVWAIKMNPEEATDQYIALSYPNNSAFLKVREGGFDTLEQSDPMFNCFQTNAGTLAIGTLNDGSLVQVTSSGIRHIKPNLSIQEHPCPHDRRVILSCLNERDVVLGLSGANNNLIYYQSDSAGKLLNASTLHLDADILAIALQSVPPNRQRARYMAVAVAEDKGSKITVYSLDSADMMQTLSVQIVNWQVSSLALVNVGSSQSTGGSSQLTLAVGTVDGILSRYQVDVTTGELSEPRNKALGKKPVRLFPVKLAAGQTGIVATSSRSWLIYNFQSSITTVPMTNLVADFVSSFNYSGQQESLLSIAEASLRIVDFERFDKAFNQIDIPLRYTPRQSAIHPHSKNLMFIAEADHNAYPLEERDQLQRVIANAEEDEQQGPSILPDASYGCAKPGPRKWGSCIRVLDLKSKETVDLVSLDNNEAAISICTCSFRDHAGDVFVCVGVVKDLVMQPKRSCSAAYINVYSLSNHGQKLTLIHRKSVEDIPGALTMFQQRLLAGVGKSLKLFDLGKKKPQLLRKCENSNFPTHIVSISHNRERIIVSDSQESVFFVKYSRPDSLTILADDIVPRWITSTEVLDFNTVAGSDKFGNVFVLRLPEKVAEVENDSTNRASPWSSGFNGVAGHNLETICSFYVGETVTRLQKVRLTPGGGEFLMYVTIVGTIGALIPLPSKNQVDFFSQLELHLRQENPPLAGRDHLAYRSSYFPVKNIIDGDLCETFKTLPVQKQKAIADPLDQTFASIQRKLEDVKNLI